MPIVAGPLPTATVIRPNTGTVERPLSGSGLGGEGGNPLLARGRAAAEALMTDECVVKEVTGSTTDPETGEVTDTVTEVYAGKCEVQQATPSAGEQRVGEADVLIVSRVLKLPVLASAGVRAGHRVRMTACRHDPDLVGRAFVVHAEFAKSHATSRRLGIEEATS